MRFRLWLPVVQTIAMVVLVWAWAHGAHEGNAAPTGSDAMEWAEGINLPVVAVVAPLEFAVRESEAAPNSKARFVGYWLVGLLCWCMTGRFVGDVTQWRKSGLLVRARLVDVTFALIAFPSAVLLAGAFGFAGKDSRVLSAWAIVWIIVTGAALLFRVLQLIKHRRRPRLS